MPFDQDQKPTLLQKISDFPDRFLTFIESYSDANENFWYSPEFKSKMTIFSEEFKQIETEYIASSEKEECSEAFYKIRKEFDYFHDGSDMLTFCESKFQIQEEDHVRVIDEDIKEILGEMNEGNKKMDKSEEEKKGCIIC